jgi:hypothetical protein
VRLKSYYKEQKVQSKLKVRKLTLIKGKGAPRLKAKAGQARALVGFTTELARQFSGADGVLGMHRFQCMETMSAICDLGKRDILTRSDLVHWRRLAAEHMFHYASAGFDAKPKFYYCQHLPQHVERGGVPRNFWVYSDESKNGEIKRVWNVMSRGHAVYRQVLLRLEWRDALDLSLQRRKMLLQTEYVHIMTYTFT